MNDKLWQLILNVTIMSIISLKENYYHFENNSKVPSSKHKNAKTLMLFYCGAFLKIRRDKK